MEDDRLWTDEERDAVTALWDCLMVPFGFNPLRPARAAQWVSCFPATVAMAAVRATAESGRTFKDDKHAMNYAAKCMRNMATNYRMFQQAERDLASYRQSIDQAA
jgi:hypothetical protein